MKRTAPQNPQDPEGMGTVIRGEVVEVVGVFM
jgi:hypothetical protein